MNEHAVLNDDSRQSKLREIGQRIREAVRRIGSEGRAAEAAGVTVSTLHRYMRGEVSAPFVALSGIAEQAGLSLDWLANGTAAGGISTGIASLPPPRYVVDDAADEAGVDMELMQEIFSATLSMDAPLDARDRADVAARMMRGIEMMSRDQRGWSRLEPADFAQIARIATKLSQAA